MQLKTEDDLINEMYLYIWVHSGFLDKILDSNVYNDKEKFDWEVYSFITSPLKLHFKREELIKYFIDITGTDAT